MKCCSKTSTLLLKVLEYKNSNKEQQLTAIKSADEYMQQEGIENGIFDIISNNKKINTILLESKIRIKK